MQTDPENPLSSASAFILLQDLCEATGLTYDALLELVLAGQMAGGLDGDSRLVGVHQGDLPSRRQLLEWGMHPKSSYEPETLSVRQVEELPNDAEERRVDSKSVRW